MADESSVRVGKVVVVLLTRDSMRLVMFSEVEPVAVGPTGAMVVLNAGNGAGVLLVVVVVLVVSVEFNAEIKMALTTS